VINDLNHFWGNDLSPGVTGDLATVSGTLLGQQRVLRRLLTNPGDYIFHPDYGAGLPGFIGRTLDVGKVVAVIRSQILLEPSVAKTPAPQITVQQLPADLTGLAVTIAYNDADSNTPVVLSFNVSA
jgi:hypothetical protein